MKIFTLFTFIFSSFFAFAQLPPSNDNPTGAVVVPVTAVGAPTNIISGTNEGSTATFTNTSPCTQNNPVPSSSPRDVWYKFNTGSYSSIIINIDAANSMLRSIAFMRIYSTIPTSGTDATVFCTNTSTSAISLDTVLLSNLLLLNTNYYIALSGFGASTAAVEPFTINIAGLGSLLPLAASITNFTLQKKLYGNLLQFNAHQQSDVKNYTIEKMTSNNITFQTITTINPTAYTNDEIFTYTDQMPNGVENKYRIKLNYIDGSYIYTNTIIQMSNTANAFLYPNPTKKIFHIATVTKIANTVNIINLKGEKIISENSAPNNTNQINLNIAQLPHGTYFVQIISELGKQNLRFIK